MPRWKRLETAGASTTGYSKVLLNKRLPVKWIKELLKSIKMWGFRCLMKITPHNPVWQ
ncbi:MAG: DUF6144 family protein [Enterocloster bolteae]